MLKNGDLIKGSLIDQTADQIVWASENFGPLTIASDRVSTVNGLTPKASFDSMASPVFGSTYAGTVSATGAYASGNEEREDWDIEGSVQWREGDFRHHSGINYEGHSLNDVPAKKSIAWTTGLTGSFANSGFGTMD